MKEEGRRDPYSRCSLANRIRAVTSIRQQNKMVYRHPSIRPPLPKNRYFCPFLIAISDFHSICRLHRFRSAAELANAARCIDRGGGQATRGCATRGWRGGAPVRGGENERGKRWGNVWGEGEMMGENGREMGEKGIHLVWLVEGAKIGDLIKRKGTRNKWRCKGEDACLVWERDWEEVIVYGEDGERAMAKRKVR